MKANRQAIRARGSDRRCLGGVRGTRAIGVEASRVQHALQRVVAKFKLCVNYNPGSRGGKEGA